MLEDWELSGPDEDGHVWIVSTEGVKEAWGRNLGPVDSALDKFASFLAANDYEERGDGIA